MDIETHDKVFHVWTKLPQTFRLKQTSDPASEKIQSQENTKPGIVIKQNSDLLKQNLELSIENTESSQI